MTPPVQDEAPGSGYQSATETDDCAGRIRTFLTTNCKSRPPSLVFALPQVKWSRSRPTWPPGNRSAPAADATRDTSPRSNHRTIDASIPTA